jgi:polar amino acid transport system substrate-binding protein
VVAVLRGGFLLAMLGSGEAFAGEPLPRDLEASLGLLPGLVDSPDSGAFVDLVKAMDAVYPGQIRIQVYPMARSVRNVITGKADFHLPALRDPEVPESDLFGVADEIIGTLSNVIYSHQKKPITRQEIDDALARGGPFPFRLESAGGEVPVKYPYQPNNQIHLALKKVNAGRIDGFIHPQEEADRIVMELELRHIHRALYSTNDDIIAIPRGERGREVNAILSDCIRKLRASGELRRLYSRIHSPYADWQPAAMAR